MDPEEIRDLQNFYHGVGFAACQKYLSSATRQMKITRSDALNLGPKHSTEGPIVALVNAIANYWKHQDEWDLKPTQRGRKETIDRLAPLGIRLGYDASSALLWAILECGEHPTFRSNSRRYRAPVFNAAFRGGLVSALPKRSHQLAPRNPRSFRRLA